MERGVVVVVRLRGGVAESGPDVESDDQTDDQRGNVPRSTEKQKRQALCVARKQ